MEEDAVLVVGEGVVDLLVPNDASGLGRYVDHLEPEGISDQVVGQHNGTLQARVGPSVPVGVGDIQLGDGDGVDLVARLGDGALDHLLVLIGQNGRHCGGGLQVVYVGGAEGVDGVESYKLGWSRAAVGRCCGPFSGGRGPRARILRRHM